MQMKDGMNAADAGRYAAPGAKDRPNENLLLSFCRRRLLLLGSWQ